MFANPQCPTNQIAPERHAPPWLALTAPKLGRLPAVQPTNLSHQTS
jgi:hypothetical protein